MNTRMSPSTINYILEMIGYIFVALIIFIFRNYFLQHVVLLLGLFLILILWGIFWRQRNLNLMKSSLMDKKQTKASKDKRH